MLSKYRIDHKSVLVSELKLQRPPIILNVFLYNGNSIRPRLIFIPKKFSQHANGYKVFAESLVTSNCVRVNFSSSDYVESWGCNEKLKSLIETESLRIISRFDHSKGLSLGEK